MKSSPSVDSAIARTGSARRESCLLLCNLDYFASLVFAAVGTGPVRAYFFMTIRAFGKLGCFQRIVRAAGGSAALRVSTFGIWHASIFSLKNIL
jgi:hypothetical protein